MLSSKSHINLINKRIKRNENIIKYFRDALDLPKDDNYKYNICSNCGVNMEVLQQNYVCPVCGIEFAIQGESYMFVSGSSSSSATTQRLNNYKGYGYYSAIQQKHICNILTIRSEICKVISIPQHVIESTAKYYNDIQQISLNLYDESNTVKGSKKYLHRGNTLLKILAACLYIISSHAGYPFKPSEIVAFMNIHGDSFSNGIVELYKLSSLGLIEIPQSKNIEYYFIIRYLKELGIIPNDNASSIQDFSINNKYTSVTVDSEGKSMAQSTLQNEIDQFSATHDSSKLNSEAKRYVNFVISILNRSKEYNICLGSFKNSRVIGSIWILIDCVGIQKTQADLEKVCSGVKKNTFMKFVYEVYNSINVFHDIFIVNGIKPPRRPKKIVGVEFN